MKATAKSKTCRHWKVWKFCGETPCGPFVLGWCPDCGALRHNPADGKGGIHPPVWRKPRHPRPVPAARKSTG